MIEIDQRSVIRTTYNFGQKLDLTEIAKGLWSIFATSKAQSRKETLIIRDPRLPVAIVHPKGLISISGTHTLKYAFQCLKAMAGKMNSGNIGTRLPNSDDNEPTFRLNQISGRFYIPRSGTDRSQHIHKRLRSGAPDYQEIEKLMDGSRGPQGVEAGWNMNLIDIFLSKNYDWCVQHGVEDVFCTKKLSKRYELEMKLRWEESPGASEITLRMTEHGLFRYTIQLQKTEFTIVTVSGISDIEAGGVLSLQAEIDSVKTKLSAFVNELYTDVLTKCQKKRVDLNNLISPP